MATLYGKSKSNPGMFDLGRQQLGGTCCDLRRANQSFAAICRDVHEASFWNVQFLNVTLFALLSQSSGPQLPNCVLVLGHGPFGTWLHYMIENCGVM